MLKARVTHKGLSKAHVVSMSQRLFVAFTVQRQVSLLLAGLREVESLGASAPTGKIFLQIASKHGDTTAACFNHLGRWRSTHEASDPTEERCPRDAENARVKTLAMLNSRIGITVPRARTRRSAPFGGFHLD
jgi:hypothetical protein